MHVQSIKASASKLALVLLLLVSHAKGQQALDRDAYLARIAELQQNGAEIARTQGKQALINEYRTLIDENPGYANNIQLETQIGLIYESDLSETGEPPDMNAAYNQYRSTMNTYDPSNPYMKQVQKMAAERAITVDPSAAEDLYWDMIETYPGDPEIIASSYYNLAKLAEQNGDAAAAKEYYEQVMKSVPQDDSLSDRERLVVEQYEANAALNLMAEAMASAQTPEQRLAALQAFIDQYPDLPYTHGDLIDDLLRSVESMGDRAESRSELKDAVRTLVRLLQARRAEDDSTNPDAQAMRREARNWTTDVGNASVTDDATTATSLNKESGNEFIASQPAGNDMESAGAVQNSQIETPDPATETGEELSAGQQWRWLVPVVLLAAIGLGALGLILRRSR